MLVGSNITDTPQCFDNIQQTGNSPLKGDSGPDFLKFFDLLTFSEPQTGQNIPHLLMKKVNKKTFRLLYHNYPAAAT